MTRGSIRAIPPCTSLLDPPHRLLYKLGGLQLRARDGEKVAEDEWPPSGTSLGAIEPLDSLVKADFDLKVRGRQRSVR